MSRFILTIVVLTLFTECRQGNNDTQATKENLIIEAESVGQFRVNETKLDDIIKTLGTDYEDVKQEDLRVERAYKKHGLSFYYQSNDSSKIISCVIITEPFNGETTKGINVNKSTMSDVSKIYGPPEWSICETCDSWTARYRGIEFEIERDKSLPKFPLDEEVHSKKKISKIFIYRNYL